MKLLLFILLISFAASGQNIDSTGWKLVGNLGEAESGKVFFYKGKHYTHSADTTAFVFIDESQLTKFQLLSLEEKLLLYAEECFNDSIMQIELGSKGRGVYYIRKRPTLEGFIQWLKNHGN